MQKYRVLYNPLSNNMAGERAVKAVKELLCGAEVECVSVIDLDYKAFVTGLAEDEKLVICGGDGTLNRFANETKDINLPEEIFYYAAGTGNDFLRDINKTQADGLVEISRYLKGLPTVEVNGRESLFINGIGYGIDGYCCEVADKIKETSDKKINYTGIAIKGLLFHFKPVNATVTVDGKSYAYTKVWLAPTMKGRFYGGGMMPAPDQDRLDPEGRLSVMVYHGVGKLKALMVFPKIFKGEHLKYKDMCCVHTGRDITVEFDRPTALQIDGETVLGVKSCRMRA